MSFDKLPYELQFNYLSYLSYSDVLNYCLTSTNAFSIYDCDDFWQFKANKVYNINLMALTCSFIDLDNAEKYALVEKMANSQGYNLLFEIIVSNQIQAAATMIRSYNDRKLPKILDFILCTEPPSIIISELFNLLEDKFPSIDNDVFVKIFRQHYANAVAYNNLDVVNTLGKYYNVEEDIYSYEAIDHCIYDLIRIRYFDMLLEDNVDMFNIVKVYYEPKLDQTLALSKMIDKWKKEANLETLRKLRLVGIDI